jgi:hypothetical protein
MVVFKFKLRLFTMKKHIVNCPQTKSKHETQVQKGVDVAVRRPFQEDAAEADFSFAL